MANKTLTVGNSIRYCFDQKLKYPNLAFCVAHVVPPAEDVDPVLQSAGAEPVLRVSGDLPVRRPGHLRGRRC
jgi:hypothetical protein